MSSGAPAISDALALGFDVGGQSVKAVAVDHEGRVLQAATAPTGIARPDSSRIEISVLGTGKPMVPVYSAIVALLAVNAGEVSDRP